MNFLNAVLVSLIAVTVVSGASAATLVDLDPVEGRFKRGESYDVAGTVYLSCDEHENEDVVTFTILDTDDNPWVVPTPKDLTFSLANCQPAGQSIGQTVDGTGGHLGVYDVQEVSLTFALSEQSPAFEPVQLQAGVLETDNNEGLFNVEVDYDPVFTVPSALSFDVNSGKLSSAIAVTATSNADSVLRFEVTGLTVDGVSDIAGATLEIQDSLSITSPAMEESGTVQSPVDFEFHVPQAIADEPFHWDVAEASIVITMEAKEDSESKSDPQSVAITFVNKDLETLQVLEDEGGVGLPGFQAAGALSMLGAVAILGRRIA